MRGALSSIALASYRFAIIYYVFTIADETGDAPLRVSVKPLKALGFPQALCSPVIGHECLPNVRVCQQ